MKKIIIFVFALCLFEYTNAYSCFRDPWMLPSSCCGCVNSCANIAYPCAYVPCKGFRDPCDTCKYCDPPSPVCQCLAICNCGCFNTPIYFPEVEYPVTIVDMNDFYYGSCFSY